MRRNPDSDAAQGEGRSIRSLPWSRTGLSTAGLSNSDSDGIDLGERAYDRALNYLSYRPRSTREVSIYLKRKGFDEETIELVVERLTRAGLLDDPGFATYWVADRSQFSPRGSRALRQELRLKGIERDTVEAALEGNDEVALAVAAGRKKLRLLHNLEEQDFRSRMRGFLLRRGFSESDTRQATAELWREVQGPPD